LLWAMRYYRQPLSELAKVMTLSPQKILNVNVKSKPSLDAIPELQKSIRMAEAELGDSGRVLVRYSGTQSMCRIMVEGPTEEITERLTRMIADIVVKYIGS
jgi:phosphoglucosamine mutase